MLISFVIIILRNGRAIFQEAIAQGLTAPLALGLCSAHLTTAFPVLSLDQEDSFLDDRSLRHRSLLVIWEVQTLLRPFAYPGTICLWKAGSLVLARVLSSLLSSIAHAFSEFEMASDVHEIFHPIARWFWSYRSETSWKYF